MGQWDKYRTCESKSVLPFELNFLVLLDTLPFPQQVDTSVLLCGLQVIKIQHFLSFQAGSFAIISLS